MFDLNFIFMYLRAIDMIMNGPNIIFQNRQEYLHSKNQPTYHKYRTLEILRIMKDNIVKLNGYVNNELLPYFEIKTKELTSSFIKQYATAIKGN
jgi:hypothetical protein